MSARPHAAGAVDRRLLLACAITALVLVLEVAGGIATRSLALLSDAGHVFADLFALYRLNKQHITSVTFWGVSDDQTWLDNEPVPGRNDHPLIYNEQHQPKAARAAIMDF